MIVQRESLEHSDTRSTSGHSSDGYDLKQKKEQRSASLADKTGGHSSAKERPGAWKDRKGVGQVARSGKRRREAAQNGEARAMPTPLSLFCPHPVQWAQPWNDRWRGSSKRQQFDGGLEQLHQPPAMMRGSLHNAHSTQGQARLPQSTAARDHK